MDILLFNQNRKGEYPHDLQANNLPIIRKKKLLQYYHAMRKIFIILAMLLGISIVGAAQSSDAKVQRNGNTFSVVKTEKSSKTTEPIATGYNYEVKGKPYPVFQGAKGGLFYINEEGNKTYLPKEVKEAILAEMKKEGTK